MNGARSSCCGLDGRSSRRNWFEYRDLYLSNEKNQSDQNYILKIEPLVYQRNQWDRCKCLTVSPIHQTNLSSRCEHLKTGSPKTESEGSKENLPRGHGKSKKGSKNDKEGSKKSKKRKRRSISNDLYKTPMSSDMKQEGLQKNQDLLSKRRSVSNSSRSRQRNRADMDNNNFDQNSMGNPLTLSTQNKKQSNRKSKNADYEMSITKQKPSSSLPNRGSSPSTSKQGKLNKKSQQKLNTDKAHQNYPENDKILEEKNTGKGRYSQKENKSFRFGQDVNDYQKPSTSKPKQEIDMDHFWTDNGKKDDWQRNFNIYSNVDKETAAHSNNKSMSEEIQRILNMSALNKTLLHRVCDNTPSVTSSALSNDKDILLIEDTYRPGLIEDCVNGKKDFNTISFGMFFEEFAEIPQGRPERTPLTLLEAFSQRIAAERDDMFNALSSWDDDRKTLKKEEIFMYFSCKPKTNLNAALFHLFQAEALCNILDKCTKDNKANDFSRVSNREIDYDIALHQCQMPLVDTGAINVEYYSGITMPKNTNSPQNNCI